MAFWNFHTKQGTVRTPLTPEEARERGSVMRHQREWECSCGAKLRIRARDSRSEGASNFVPFPKGHKYVGHSQIPTTFLSWNGMAVERGWSTDPVKCPACVRGMPLKEYKHRKRSGKL